MPVFMNEKLETLIRRVIFADNVSVFRQHDDETTMYQIITDDGNNYKLLQQFLYSYKNLKFYEYSIFVNDNEVACQIISDRTRAYTPMESSILKLFKMCSDKVIYQEMKAAIHKNTIKIDKQYMN